MDTLTITRPDDWHLHVRDDEALNTVVPHTARQFGRAIIMPNLKPPVTRVEQAIAYRDRICAAIPAGTDFTPLMTLYLTNTTTVEDIEKAAAHPDIHAAKLYPAGATTNADAGVTDIRGLYDVLAAMQEHQLPLLVHGEVTDPEIDVFDRETRFIDRVMVPIIDQFRSLRVVLEHITTRDAVGFILSTPERVAATITAHHLLLNRNAMFQGGIQPHHYCLPVLKRECHRDALLYAIESGNSKFFLGTDSAPHAELMKQSGCGCAGIYTAHAALELYAEAFDEINALDKLEGFASFHGADFYGLPRNSGSITLQRESQDVPESYEFGSQKLIPLRAGGTLNWSVTA